MSKQPIDLPGINMLHIELTNRCNFRCDFCPITVSKRKRHPMDINLFRQIIDDIAKEDNVKIIQLHVLGEPLLHRNVQQAVEYASKKGLKVMITTNGSMLTRKTVLELSDRGLYNIDIPLQTYSEALHRVRRTDIDFNTYRDRVFNAINTIHNETGIQLIVKMMNTRYKKLFALDKAIFLEQSGRAFYEAVRHVILNMYAAIGFGISEREVEQALLKADLNKALRIRLAERLFVFIQLFMG